MISKEIDRLIRYPHLFGQFLGFEDLSEIHSEWIRHLWLSKEDVSLQAHRNSYKTTAVIIVGCIWNLIQNPEDTILILREETTNAEKTLSAIANLYDTQELKWFYKTVLGVSDIRTSQWSTRSLRLSTKKKATPEGNVEAKGMDSSLTGSHYKRICVDDIITENDRYSPAKREKTKRKIFELSNIKKADGIIQASGTPWHPDDGHKHLPKPLIYRITDDVWRIKKFTKEKAEEIKKTMPLSLWAANYELRHVADEGRIFSDPVFEKFPEDLKVIGALDTAFGGGNNTAVAVGGHKNGLYYITGRSWNKSVSVLHDDIISFIDSYKCGSLYVEDNADKKATSTALLVKRKFGVHGFSESGNKHAKIMANLHTHWSKIRFDPDIDKTFLYNLLEYQENFGIDDEADAAAMLMRKLLEPKGGTGKLTGW